MRSKKDLEAIHAAGTAQFGYVDITMYNCPPFVMFTNGNDCAICDYMCQGRMTEPESTYLWSRLMPLATSACDIGTRCGEYTLIAAALRQDMPIVSCEPNPDGYARLMVNIRANDARNVMARRYAVSNAEGYVNFGWMPKFLGHISSGGHLVAGVASQEAIKGGAVMLAVETMRLDKIVEDIDLGRHPAIKIDVEGAEALVFDGMRRVLQSTPDIIVETFSKEACDLMMARTQDLGYRYYFVEEDERRIIPIDRLAPCDPSSNSRNQLLSARPPEVVLGLSSSAAV